MSRSLWRRRSALAKVQWLLFLHGEEGEGMTEIPSGEEDRWRAHEEKKGALVQMFQADHVESQKYIPYAMYTTSLLQLRNDSPHRAHWEQNTPHKF